MERIEDRYIELQGRFAAVLYKDKNSMVTIFNDDRYGNINLIVPYQCVLYSNFSRNKVYKLMADLQGQTRPHPSGKTFTKNNLIVKRVLH